MYGCVIDFDATFGPHFFDMAQAERIGHVPANARQDDFSRMMQPQEHCDAKFRSTFFDQFASSKPIISTLLRQNHVDCPKSPFSQDLITFMAKQACVTKNEFYGAKVKPASAGFFWYIQTETLLSYGSTCEMRA